MTDAGSNGSFVLAVWAGLALVILALIGVYRHVQRNRRQSCALARPHVTISMEPHSADWDVIDLVVRNFGTAVAYDIRFRFPEPPTVAEYETAADGYVDVVELPLPDELATLAPGQEWRTVWDSALDRAELGDSIESRFAGTVTYYDRPERKRRWRLRQRRPQLETTVVLNWDALQPARRVELMTNHDLATRENQKLELLRSTVNYFHDASNETQADAYRREIDRINRAVKEIQEKSRSRQLEVPTVGLRFGDLEVTPGKHHS